MKTPWTAWGEIQEDQFYYRNIFKASTNDTGANITREHAKVVGKCSLPIMRDVKEPHDQNLRCVISLQRECKEWDAITQSNMCWSYCLENGKGFCNTRSYLKTWSHI